MEQTEKLTKAERVRKYGEVFTPGWMATWMCDLMEQENPDAFQPEKTFLEPTCGEGVFLCEILKRKFSRCKKRSDFTTALKSVYGLELLEDNVEETIRQVTYLCTGWFQPTKAELETIRDHIIQADSLKIMKMWKDPAINEYLTERGDGDG